MEDIMSKLEKYGAYPRNRFDLSVCNIELLRVEGKLKIGLKPFTEEP